MTVPVSKEFKEEFEPAPKKQKVGCWGKLRSRRINKLTQEECEHLCPLMRSPHLDNLSQFKNVTWKN